jgi:hypothetical protein
MDRFGCHSADRRSAGLWPALRRLPIMVRDRPARVPRYGAPTGTEPRRSKCRMFGWTPQPVPQEHSSSQARRASSGPAGRNPGACDPSHVGVGNSESPTCSNRSATSASYRLMNSFRTIRWWNAVITPVRAHHPDGLCHTPTRVDVWRPENELIGCKKIRRA